MTIFDAAQAAIPGYTAAAKARDTARGWQKNLAIVSDRTPLESQIRNELLAAANQGGDLPTDILDRLDEHDRRARTAFEHNKLLISVRQACESAVHQVVLAGISSAYSVLEDELGDIIQQCLAIDIARTPMTADRAIAADAVNAWQRANALVSRYEDLRAAQQKFARDEATDPIDRHTFAVAGQLTDAIDHDPHWLMARREAAQRTRTGSWPGRQELIRWWTQPAPTSAPDRRYQRNDLWPESITPKAWLGHIAANATAAVPDADHIIGYYALANRACRPASDETSARAALAARDHLMAGRIVADADDLDDMDASLAGYPV